MVSEAEPSSLVRLRQAQPIFWLYNFLTESLVFENINWNPGKASNRCDPFIQVNQNWLTDFA